MTEPSPLNRPDQSRPIGAPEGVSGAKPGAAPAKTSEGGVEFQAMLDRIEERARELSAASSDPLQPQELAGAVDRARESLEDVMTLKEQLLEAYRQAQSQRPDAGEGK
jgi:hypothetical protein